MKKVGFLLLAIVLLTYGYQGYKVVELYTNDVVKIKSSAKLSDITEKILPVPLDTPPDTGAVKHVKRVRRDGDNLFLLSDNRLLHFDMQGKFINRIAGESNPENDVKIVDYVLNTDKHQALVVDSERNIRTFDYNGRLISNIRIDKLWNRITAFAFHDGCLWVTAESLAANYGNPESYRIEHKLYQLDLNMNEIYSMTLRTSGIKKSTMFNGLLVDELLADEQGVYAYATVSDSQHLLEDTLHIAQQKKIPLLYKDAHYGMACIYPVRKGKRYYLSTNDNRSAGDGLTFCYDDKTLTAYMLSDGFKDDFYHTGKVSDLQPMDMYNDSYCFLKSGKDIARKFSERAKNDDAPVLFIFKLST